MIWSSFGQTDFLKTDGKYIRNNSGKGDTVNLYGLNIGGWEIIEPWMAPMSGALDEWEARNTLANRFGWDSAVALKKIYLASWFRNDDFARISAEHLNCVRLPILWCDYMDTNGNWLKKPNGDTNFTLLDTFVVQASKYGIYTIFDLHGAPGSQNGKDHSGRENGLLLYSVPKYKSILINWWKGIASHFKCVAAVAGYDLLNEPSSTYPNPMGSDVIAFYDTLYKEIRKIDPDHMIFMEGIWTWDVLPQPSTKNWTNVVYQLHWYYTGDPVAGVDGDVSAAITHMDSWKVPCLVGEYHFSGQTAYGTNKMSQNRINWTMWTYKVNFNTDWGMYIPSSLGSTPNLSTDTYAQIAQKWNTWDTQNHFTRNTGVADALKAAATLNGEPKHPLPVTGMTCSTPVSRETAPSKDQVSLQVTTLGSHSIAVVCASHGKFAVTLMSIDGRIVAHKALAAAGQRCILDTRNIAPGLYQILVKAEGATGGGMRQIAITR
jgi:aryl-phospho-beta-D-glucosidase BglC (GH1 family)